MESFATPLASSAQAETWEAYPLISPNKFLVLCLLSLGLYGLWWQYKTWRFFRQWQQTDTWPVMRALFSLFTFHDLLKTINQFARSTGGYTPIANPGGLASGYVVLSLLTRLPDPLWLVSLGAIGFLVPAFRAFRDAMLQAPAYGGSHQPHFSARQLIALSAGLVGWSLVFVGLMQPD
ncbi:hypothetical protein [Hymenobacter negativus]|uniref:DUF4234 domain-containing protein n=1 Tax=Hymenobacter negativus TaxID=2795026 RepID=A0ABS3QG80_9BACT|nr:hypothetical protein [Hymenobacter negativus]MBO2010231.1 hypothetical protein [Hymenobacter negativus]